MTEFFYKPIKFRDRELITQQLKIFGEKYNPDNKKTIRFDNELLEVYAPSLAQQFKEMDLHLDIFRGFVTYPRDELGIHRDGSLEYPKKLAINWPVENCAGTQMYWWKFFGDPILEEQSEQFKFEHDISASYNPQYKSSDALFNYDNVLVTYEKTNAEIVEKLELTDPTLINVDIHHSVGNPFDTFRKIISFRFIPEPLHLI